MQDRNLHDRKRQRRKRRIKQKKRTILFRRIFLLAILFIVLYVLGRFAASKLGKDKEESSPKTQDENSKKTLAKDKEDKNLKSDDIKFSLEEDTKDEVKKGPAVDTNITFEMMKKDLDKRVDQFLKTQKISKENLSIGYFNMDTDESYLFNQSKEFNVGWANNFIIAMDVYDLASEKHIDLDGEFYLEDLSSEDKSNSSQESNNSLSKKFTLREMIKLVLKEQNEEVRDNLISFIEEKSSKNWYDELSKRYGINLSYTNKMTAEDSLKILRRLFSERRMTAEERINSEDDEKTSVLVYQELINFMSENISSNAFINGLSKKSQVSAQSGKEYDDQVLFGYILGQKQYLYVLMSSKTDQQKLYDGLAMVDQWHDYYHN